ncbi:hypothetical protein CLG96_14955 [Sphingomonas oleivorans]|uniref:DUF423 domain-containing protein n=1 Tax=Sphingomonas oleivorans TaxID=1735121 RepID=A0A2T5FUU8_9SPHN|nr:DUF423 domain-containing protein [Sphingomonas oleivorans]PTQ08503.1 hypothetical protein CLG96_14955 [Sphingomonas oleivorans]
MRRGAGMFGLLAALSGALAVLAGAAGAHGHEGRAAEWLRTGAQYQMVHAVAALVALQMPKGRAAALFFLIGAAIFSGTLYAMALGWPRWLGAVTPIGGLGMILGWLILAMVAARR